MFAHVAPGREGEGLVVEGERKLGSGLKEALRLLGEAERALFGEKGGG